MCGDVSGQQILIKSWMSIQWKEWDGPLIDLWSYREESRSASWFETWGPVLVSAVLYMGARLCPVNLTHWQCFFKFPLDICLV